MTFAHRPKRSFARYSTTRRSSLRDELTADDIPGWDSLTHINLMVATEKRFKVKFATAEISKLKEDGQNVGAFLALLNKKLAR